jgi:hypothetical protein
MPSFKDKLVAEFGEEEAARILSERLKRARANRKDYTVGGFNNPELAKRASQISHEKRQEGRDETKSSTEVKDPTQS